MYFQDISRFSDTSKYLPLLNGAISTELCIFYLIIIKYIQTKSLKKWYHDLGLSAVLADVLSASTGVVIATFFYPYLFSRFHILALVALSMGVQITHDVLFSLAFKSVPRGRSQIFDIFQDYAKELGYKILFYDSLIMISTVLLGSLYASMGDNANIVLAMVQIYLIPYLLYSL